MRIALVSNTLSPPGHGGAETCVVALAEHLRQSHEVIVFSGAATQLEGVRCLQIPALDPLPHDAHPIRKAVMHARDQWMWSVHRDLRRGLARESIDIVNTHEVQGLSSAVFTAVASLGLAHVHTAHDPSILCTRIHMTRSGHFCGGYCLLCRPQRVIRGRAARARLDALIAPSDSLREMHVAAGIVPPNRAFTIRQGAVPGKARLRTPDPTSVRVGYIGRLAPHKGVLTLLRTAQMLPTGWCLFVAGSGQLAPTVLAAARGNRRIEYMGYVEGQAKEDFFDLVDLLVIPSEWEEPAPLVATEAAIRGIPTVVSNRGGLPEVPISRVFKAGDASSLAQTIERFITDDGVTRASRNLLARRDEFLMARNAEATENILRMAARQRASLPNTNHLAADLRARSPGTEG